MNWWKLRCTSYETNVYLCAPSALHSQIACGPKHFLEPFQQEGSQTEYRGQYLRSPNPNTNSSSASNPAKYIHGRQRSFGPSDSEIAGVEGDDDEEEEGSTLIQAPAKESALLSPADHVASVAPTDTQDLDDIKPEELLWVSWANYISELFLPYCSLDVNIH